MSSASFECCYCVKPRCLSNHNMSAVTGVRVGVVRRCLVESQANAFGLANRCLVPLHLVCFIFTPSPSSPPPCNFQPYSSLHISTCIHCDHVDRSLLTSTKFHVRRNKSVLQTRRLRCSLLGLVVLFIQAPPIDEICNLPQRYLTDATPQSRQFVMNCSSHHLR